MRRHGGTLNPVQTAGLWSYRIHRRAAGLELCALNNLTRRADTSVHQLLLWAFTDLCHNAFQLRGRVAINPGGSAAIQGSGRLRWTSRYSLKNERAMPFIEFPKIIPKIGIATRAEYHGSGPMMNSTTMTPTRSVLTKRAKKANPRGYWGATSDRWVAA